MDDTIRDIGVPAALIGGSVAAGMGLGQGQDWGAAYQDLANEVTGQLEQAKNFGITKILSGTGSNAEELKDAAAAPNRSNITGPMAQALQNRARMGIAQKQAGAMGGLEAGYGAKEAQVGEQAGMKQIGVTQEQNEATQQMLGNTIKGIGSIGGALVGNASLADQNVRNQFMQVPEQPELTSNTALNVPNPTGSTMPESVPAPVAGRTASGNYDNWLGNLGDTL